MKGSIISATEGDAHSAKRSQKMARALICEHRAVTPAGSEGRAGGASAPASGGTEAEWTE
jgi:hypothetical protein